MKNVLIVIHALGCGGAEKSLVSFLKALPEDKWNIDLLVASPVGMFMDEIPKYVNRVTDLYDVENYASRLEDRRKKVCGIRDFISQVKWQIQSKICKYPELTFDEKRWKIWGRYLPKMEKEYDLAVSYMNGFPNYFVIEKVKAKKKILWVHTDFDKRGFNYEFEQPFYQKADSIVTISQACVDSIVRVYPEFEDKTVVLENISSAKVVNNLAKEKIDDEYFNDSRMKILSIGRLNEVKGFDFAIEAAKILRNKNLDFVWYIVGEGPLRTALQVMIDKYNLTDRVKMIGIRPNPYPYIAECDIFVQPSRCEGKSIVLDEAKILCKPIVVTNYETVVNSISAGVNGVIAEMTPESIANAIYNLAIDDDRRKCLSDKLRSENNGNDDEIVKYIALFDKYLS